MSQDQTSNRPAALPAAPIPPSTTMPRRVGWNTDNLLCGDKDVASADAMTEFMHLWHEWADTAENVLSGMIHQLEERSISYDDYLTLVRRFVSYPARPALRAASTDHDLHLIMPDIFMSGAWNKWADAVEMIVGDMKAAIARGVPLPREEQVMREGDLVDFSLDLSKQDPSPMHVAAHLRKMLRDGRRDDLVDDGLEDSEALGTVCCDGIDGGDGGGLLAFSPSSVDGGLA